MYHGVVQGELTTQNFYFLRTVGHRFPCHTSLRGRTPCHTLSARNQIDSVGGDSRGGGWGPELYTGTTSKEGCDRVRFLRGRCAKEICVQLYQRYLAFTRPNVYISRCHLFVMKPAESNVSDKLVVTYSFHTNTNTKPVSL